MSKKIDGPGLAALSVGAVFLFAGIKGYSPLKAFENIIQGKHPDEGQSTTMLTNGSSGSSGSNFTGTVDASGNQKIAQQLAIQMGYGNWTSGQMWTDWVALWNQESGWSQSAKNPSSGAYGIPQALPANKMASAGSDWQTNPATQIKWGIDYIAGRYGNPSNAEAHEKQFNWY